MPCGYLLNEYSFKKNIILKIGLSNKSTTCCTLCDSGKKKHMFPFMFHTFLPGILRIHK